jgi:hypothetical protein
MSPLLAFPAAAAPIKIDSAIAADLGTIFKIDNKDFLKSLKYGTMMN